MNPEKATYEALKTLGVPANLLGYVYLQDAAFIVYENPEAIRYMTKGLYPEIAEKRRSTASRVERAIRHAVEHVYSNTDPRVLQKYFGNTANMSTGKLTNSQFIAGLVEYIKMEVRS